MSQKRYDFAFFLTAKPFGFDPGLQTLDSIRKIFVLLNDDGLKPFDFGVNAMMSFETKIGLQFIANYNHGFINLIPGDASRPNMQSHYFGIRGLYVLSKFAVKTRSSRDCSNSIKTLRVFC